ncbi:MAG TPA: non-homologous end-joining DNA ligase [Candidatus Angelobacter sp.]|nr:non-homologous end-joining DNA ligase [Candidatus Angelobacter sp.]
MKRSQQSQERVDVRGALSNPDKIYWPEEGTTKLDLAEYYEAVFPRLAPYINDRMLSLERCPAGMSGPCFYQKQAPKGMPADTPTKRIEHVTGDKSTNYVVGGALATQIALVNLGCIAVHVTGSRADAPRQPDWMCIDIDPESGEFADAARAGLYVKEFLDALHLTSFAKTSGSRGLHVLAPLRRGPDVDEVLSFARLLVSKIAAAHPDELTVEHSVKKRGGRVYLDPFRNGFMQTVVAPYSVRRREHAPVSTPLSWSEVQPSLIPGKFTISNFQQRLQKPDPWEDFFKSGQSLSTAARFLNKL